MKSPTRTPETTAMTRPSATAERVIPAAPSTGALVTTPGRAAKMPLGFATYAGARSRTTISQAPRTKAPPASLSATDDSARRRPSGREEAEAVSPIAAGPARISAPCPARR